MTWFQQLGIVACALAIGIGEAAAEYRFDVWTAESGLPQNTVRDILQTRDGYLWVATLDGLARFDGVRFTVFNKANSPNLSSNRILALYEDREGDLWIGLDDGSLIRMHSGHFTKCGTADGLPGVGIQTISGNALADLWVSAGAAPLQWKDGKFLPAMSESATRLIPDGQIHPNRAGIFWNTNQVGVHIFFHGKLTTLGISNGLPSLQINHVDQDQRGNWWLATDAAGLVKMRDGKVLKTYTTQNGLPRNAVSPKASWIFPSLALEDHKGNLWLNGAGPWLGRLKDGVFTAYPSAENSTAPFLPLTPGQAGSQINKLFEDREGNLWIGTEGSGLIRAREQIVNVISTRQGLQAANIYPVFADRNEAVWLGTWDLGLARINSGAITNFSLSFPHENVTAFCQDRSGRLWVGTIGGVFIFENDKLSMTGVPMAFAHQPVSAICEDRNGVLWFGAERGLFQYQNGEVTLHEQKEVPGVIKVIIEDRAGSLWIGSRFGLARLANDRSTTWTEKDGLPSGNITAVYEDNDGTLWIGSGDGGLARFKEGRFTRYTTREGMFDNGVFQILEDAGGNFWMSCNRGIYRVNKTELNEFAEGRRRSITSIAYGKSDGMLNPECNGGRSPAGTKTRDGRLWFPTQDGVAVIDPAALSTNPKPPPVVIESFQVERVPQSLQGELHVPPRKSNIEIQYTGLSLVNSDQIKFKYRLVGAEDDWVEAGTRRVANYSHLSPGKYTFTVLAANSDGLWNDTGASLAFTVLPAWHQTTWFRGLAVLAIVAAAVGFYRRRVSRLEAQRVAQQDFSRRLIESQELERKRIAGELHDSLGQHLLVIKNRAAMGLNPVTATAPEQFNEITRAATQALEEVREISQNLRPYQLDRLGLTRALHGLMKKVSASSNLKCEADIAPLDGVFPPEAEINLYRIVQEGLNNILKHSGATEARVTVERDAARMRLVIEDNGRGFDPDTASANPERAGGMGLSGITERTRILRGRLEIQSSPGGGTRLKIALPLPTEKKS